MSRVERIIRVIFVLFMAAILGAIVYGHGGQSSEVSNWIIAGANVVMALAAVQAFRAAPKFLNEFFAKEGYRLVIEMINENIIHLGMDNEFTVKFHNAVVTYRSLIGTSYPPQNYDKFPDSVKELNGTLAQHKEYLKNIRHLSFKIQTYSIYASDKKKQSWTDMVLCLDGMIREAELILHYFSLETKNYYDNFALTRDIFQPFKGEHSAHIEEHFKNLNTEWNGMVKNRYNFLSEGMDARSLFVLK